MERRCDIARQRGGRLGTGSDGQEAAHSRSDGFMMFGTDKNIDILAECSTHKTKFSFKPHRCSQSFLGGNFNKKYNNTSMMCFPTGWLVWMLRVAVPGAAQLMWVSHTRSPHCSTKEILSLSKYRAVTLICCRLTENLFCKMRN